ncbi:MAG: hypothetical protein J7527_17270 [Chitinophagaceae bacterium]|nr:hypothetical protein [Chitinophagaceae bacterium]
MDIQTNEQEYIDIRYLRISTRRQKIRRIKRGYEKDLLRLDRERTRLWKAQREKVYVELIKPYQSGWRRSFELRSDVAQSRHADFFSEILKSINTVQRSHRKDFKKKVRKFGKKVYKPRTQELHELYSWQWLKLGEREQKLFHEVWSVDCYKRPVIRYAFNEPWRFVLKVRPNIIRRTILINPEMESDMAELEGMIDRQFLEPYIDKLKGGHVRSYYRRESPYEPRCKYRTTVRQYQDLLQNEI